MSDISLENLICHQDNLETVLDNLKEGIIAHDLNRRIFFFNKEAERISGYSRQEILGRDCHEAFDSPFCGEHCAFCVDEPELADTSEYTINITTKAGDPRRLEATITSMKNSDGQLTGVLSSFRDVTDLFSLKMKAAELTLSLIHI